MAYFFLYFRFIPVLSPIKHITTVFRAFNHNCSTANFRDFLQSLHKKRQKRLSAVELNVRAHRHNLANKSWGGGQNPSWALGTLRSSQVRKREKIGLKKPLIYTHPLPPLLSQYFIFVSSTQQPKNYSQVGKILGGGHLPPLTPPVSPMYDFCDFMLTSTDSGETESEVSCLRPIGNGDLDQM